MLSGGECIQKMDMKKNENPGRKHTYTPKEISEILGISIRSAYNLCSTTTEFKTLRIGRSVRIMKASFDEWLGISSSR